LESEIIHEAPPTIHELSRPDRRYAYGIGLYIVLDAGVIDRTAIEQAITQFCEMGETDWQAANSAPRERFSIVSEKDALTAMMGSAKRIDVE
ncbi:MAG: hypothetical protein O2966_05330, partial [Proteobacteria bacterium]|nr:hypothetical protein [Pseudomonadota bacterium]